MIPLSNVPTYCPAQDTLPTAIPATARPRHSSAPMPALDVAGESDRGQVRARNEDHFVVASLERGVRVCDARLELAAVSARTRQVQGSLLAVADGMGGHAAGDIASAVALDAFLSHVAHAMPWLAGTRLGDEESILGELVRAVEASEARLRSLADSAQLDPERPGTTLTAAYIAWPAMYLVHVGDTRCYIARGDELTQVTRDHTLAQQHADASGGDPGAPGLAHVLCNAVGGDTTPARAETRMCVLHPGDAVIVCSDGLYREVDPATLHAIVRDASSSRDAARTLVDRANAAGGHDNITAVVARFAAS